MWVFWEPELGLSALVAPEGLSTGLCLVTRSADSGRVLGFVRAALSLRNDMIDLGRAFATLVALEPVASEDRSAFRGREVLSVLALVPVPVRGHGLAF